MQARASEQDWFRTWFGPSYKSIYAHRNERQAKLQVEALLKIAVLHRRARILDVGCGTGRHMRVLLRKGFERVHGLDLSRALLRDARSGGLNVVRADMRHPPFAGARFDLVACFFTSFGYFATIEEDMAALAEFVRLLRPGAYLFLDLINKEYLAQNFVPRDERRVEDMTVVQTRRLEGPVVVKDIEIRRDGDLVEAHQERVRLYSLEEFEDMARRCHLRLHALFGSERGGAYHRRRSPRMGMVFRPAV